MREGIYDVPLKEVNRKLDGIYITLWSHCIVGEGNGWNYNYVNDRGRDCRFCHDL